MKNTKYTLFFLLALLFANLTVLLSAQSGKSWTSKDLLEPEVLAGMLNK